jgi:hypothetical protein
VRSRVCMPRAPAPIQTRARLRSSGLPRRSERTAAPLARRCVALSFVTRVGI